MNKESSMVPKSKIAQHMHVHYFYGESGRCICGSTRDELIAQQKDEIKKAKSNYSLIY